jgi:hypothetical protein
MIDAANLEASYEIFATGHRKDIPTGVLLVVLRVIQDIQYKYFRILALHISVCKHCLGLQMCMHRFAEAPKAITGSQENTHPS